ncbi:MAG: glycosyltransferase family 39 protein [Anaerolineae bacterium]|nr:glycosyltransferase family 39 protein [Anaerolineae bacterium]
MSVKRQTVMVVILLLAACLRFHDLDAQSFWYDEGNSARIVERTPQLIVEAAAGDIHPPGYYLLLAGWRLFAGFSEFSLRSFSVFWSLLTVALAYALGARLLNRSAGLFGALIVAVHAFQVYYAQEARMYAMLAGVAAASMYAFVRWLTSPPGPNTFWLSSPPIPSPFPHKGGKGARARSESPLSLCGRGDLGVRGKWAIAWMLLNALGLYTQYVYPAVMLAQGIVFVVWWAGRRDWRALVQYTVLNLVTTALFLPWLPVALRQITMWPAGSGGASFGEALGKTMALLLCGGALYASGAEVFVVLALLLAGAASRSRRGGWLLLGLWALLPLLGMFALGLYRPAFLKALLIGQAPLAMLVGCGFSAAAAWSRKFWPVLLLVLLFSFAPATAALYDPAGYRADYRAMARAVEAHAAPTDAVLLDAANQWEVFTYYYREDDPGNVPVYPIPRTRPVDADATRAELDAILAKHRRLYVLYWGDAESDPERVVEDYLRAHAFEVRSAWYKDVRFVTYAVPPSGAAQRVAVDARFAGGPLLAGYVLNAPEPATPGSALALALFWEAGDEPPSYRCKVFVHLVDAGGAVVAQHDAEPDPLRPTDTWAPGDQVTDHHGLLIPADAAPGEYQIVVGLYHVDDPTFRLPAASGDALPLAAVTVTAAALTP